MSADPAADARYYLEVAAGLREILSCDALAGPAGPAEPWTLPDAGAVEIDGRTWFPDDELAAACPAAVWAVSIQGGEQDGTWLGYSPGTGVVEAWHHEGQIAVPLSWTGPDPDPDAARALAGIRVVAAAAAAAPAVDLSDLRPAPPAACTPDEGARHDR